MRTGSLIGGIVLLVVGIMSLAAGAVFYVEGQTLGGLFLQAFWGFDYTAIGGVLLLIGGILAVAGLALIVRGVGTSAPADKVVPHAMPSLANPATSSVQDPSAGQEGTRESRFCVRCGGRVPRDGMFCPSCGSPQG